MLAEGLGTEKAARILAFKNKVLLVSGASLQPPCPTPNLALAALLCVHVVMQYCTACAMCCCCCNPPSEGSQGSLLIPHAPCRCCCTLQTPGPQNKLLMPRAPYRRCCRPLQAPAPPEGSQNNLLALYSQNQGQRVAKKAFRALPQHPDKILDAPELLDDYYLNLLDWGPNNVVRRGRCRSFISAAASACGDRPVPSICCKIGQACAAAPLLHVREELRLCYMSEPGRSPINVRQSRHVLMFASTAAGPACSESGPSHCWACHTNPSDLRCSKCSWLRHCRVFLYALQYHGCSCWMH